MDQPASVQPRLIFSTAFALAAGTVNQGAGTPKSRLDVSTSCDHRAMLTLARWERVSSLPLAFATVAFLVAYAWPILDVDMASGLREVLGLVVIVTWTAFALDVLARLALADDRADWLKRNSVDVIAVALPMLRPLRLLRLLALITTLNRFASMNLRGRVGMYLGGSIVVLSFVSALAVLDAERGSEGSIQSFGDALWWSFATLTTVGYGDVFPVTGTGRVVAVGLMLAGIAALGVVTASIASWMIEQVSIEAEDAQAATQKDVAELRAEVARLTSAIERLGSVRASRPQSSSQEQQP